MSSDLSLQVETLQELTEIAQAAVRAESRVAVVKLPDEPPGVYGLVDSVGKLIRCEAAPPPRKHTLLSVDQIPDLVERYRTLNQAPSVWISPEAVVVVLDDTPEKRIDGRAVCQLRKTDELQTLESVGAKESWLNQKQFIRLIRTKLADALGDQLPQLVATLRNIRFSSGTAGRGNLEHGRESLGREIESEVMSEVGDIPHTLRLDVRVFTDPAIKVRFPVDVALEIEPSNGTFALMPLGDGLQRIIDEQVSALRDLLGGLDCPVVYGAP